MLPAPCGLQDSANTQPSAPRADVFMHLLEAEGRGEMNVHAGVSPHCCSQRGHVCLSFKGSFYKDIYVFTFTDVSGTPWSSLRFLCPTNRSDFLTTGLLLTTPKCSLIISTTDKKVSNSTGLGVLTTLPTGVFKLSGQRETLSQCGV